MSETKKENDQELTQLTDEEIEAVSGGGGEKLFVKLCRLCGKTVAVMRSNSDLSDKSQPERQYVVCRDCQRRMKQ